MKKAFFLAIGLFMGIFMTTNGVLLIFWPRHFLRFYDFYARGEWVKTATWRKDVGNFDWKMFGLITLVAGIAILWDVVPRIAGLR